MSPRHFSKMMQSPYFQTEHYRKETTAGKLEYKISNFFYLLKKRIIKALTLKKK
jgi:hypothetical protein